jgi:hypothetical protein
VESNWVHSALRPPMAYCASPGWLWWCRNRWNDWQGKPKYSEKTCPVTLCAPQTPHAARTRTRAAAVGSQRLTASAAALFAVYVQLLVDCSFIGNYFVHSFTTCFGLTGHLQVWIRATHCNAFFFLLHQPQVIFGCMWISVMYDIMLQLLAFSIYVSSVIVYIYIYTYTLKALTQHII